MFLDKHLKGKDFVVGNKATVADYKIAAIFTYAFSFFFDGGYRKAIPNLTKWYERMTADKHFISRFGKVKLC